MFQITLKDARILSGFTLEDVAVACEVTVSEVEKYEHDTRKIPFDLAKKIKRLFCINLEQIFIGVESEYKICFKKRAQNMPSVPKTCLKNNQKRIKTANK